MQRKQRTRCGRSAWLCKRTHGCGHNGIKESWHRLNKPPLWFVPFLPSRKGVSPTLLRRYNTHTLTQYAYKCGLRVRQLRELCVGVNRFTHPGVYTENYLINLCIFWHLCIFLKESSFVWYCTLATLIYLWVIWKFWKNFEEKWCVSQ